MVRRTRSLVPMLALAVALLSPALAFADATAFWGVSPRPDARSTRGFALGMNLVVFGFELDYSNTKEKLGVAPGVATTMLNGLVQTPTSRTQLYLTMGGGFYREKLGTAQETNIGTNVGGGLKIGLAGPLRLRLDYRVFRLRGSAQQKTPQRAYAGVNINF